MPEIYLKTEVERDAEHGGGVWSMGGDIHIGPRWSVAYVSNTAKIYLPPLRLLMERFEKINEGEASGLRFYKVRTECPRPEEKFGRMLTIDDPTMGKISDAHSRYMAELKKLEKKCERQAKSAARAAPEFSRLLKDGEFVKIDKCARLAFAIEPLNKELFAVVEGSVPGIKEYPLPTALNKKSQMLIKVKHYQTI